MSTAQGGIASLTPREADALAVIQRLDEAHGYPPTRREIAAEMGVSLTRARQYIDALERAGVLRRDAGTPRGLALVAA